MTQQDSSIPVQPDEASQHGTPTPASPSGGGWRGAAATIGVLLAAPAIALLLTAFVFQSYEVDGPSMESTLQNRDRLIVWKVPRTVARLTGHDYVPHRDDVVVFVKHDLFEPGSTQQKQLIKRVIGVPGDRVLVRDGHVTIYNAQHPEGFNPDVGHDFSANIAAYTGGDDQWTIAQGQVFVCGDNRVNSLDSRSFGPIATHDIVGKLTIRIWPASKFKSFI